MTSEVKVALPEYSVLAVDPGKTCGYVVWLFEKKRTMAGECNLSQLLSLATRLVAIAPIAVLAEAFRLIPGKSLALSGQRGFASEALGALKVFCLDHELTLVEQSATVVGTVGRTLLMGAGLWEPTRGLPHARDAARHLVAYSLSSKSKRKAV